MANVDDPRPIRIGECVFEPATGEIASSRGERRSRLPPQPAQLLELLADKQGALATRDEIREALWPETHVDFDQSVSFCVRQIRSALREADGEADWIETLPRRGYRLTAPSARIPSDRPTGQRKLGSLGRLTTVAAAALTMVVVVWLLARPAERPNEAPRLAIMPFELAATSVPGGDDHSQQLAGISERVLAEASRRWADRLQVVGPRSTAPYSAFPFPDLERLASELEVDYVLNGRFLERDGQLQLIVELIRLDDGAHPWAQFFPLADDVDTVVSTTVAELAAALELTTH